MEVKQVYVTWENPSKIFSIIEDELLEQINTQIYVKNEIYLAMRKNGYNYHVFSQNYTKGYHYYHTDDENGYLSDLNKRICNFRFSCFLVLLLLLIIFLSH